MESGIRGQAPPAATAADAPALERTLARGGTAGLIAPTQCYVGSAAVRFDGAAKRLFTRRYQVGNPRVHTHARHAAVPPLSRSPKAGLPCRDGITHQLGVDAWH